MRGYGTFVYGMLAICLTGIGCGQGVPVLENFSIDVERGTTNPVVIIRPTDSASLEDCNVTVTVTMEDGGKQTFSRVKSFWTDPVRIDLPKGSRVEIVELGGGGTRIDKTSKVQVVFRKIERVR